MAPSEITKVSNMSYPYSKRRPTGKPYNPFQTQFTEHVIDGKETVKLLEAPPITRKSQWLRSFMHAEEKLTPKLKKYGAAALISVFGNHFDINTHVASEEAEEYVRRFKKSLLSVDNLSPMGYYNDVGANLTGKVRKDTRPPNLAFVLAEVSVPLRSLHTTFAKSRPFHQQFYLKLPQTLKVQPSSSNSPHPISALHPPVPPSTPVRLFGSARLHRGTPPAPITPAGAGSGSNSNDSWDLDELMKTNPKMAKLMSTHKKSTQASVLSYHGPLTMFDNQGCFDATFPAPVEMYKISSQSSNAVSIFEHDRDNEDLEKVYEEILFNIFLDEYKLQYVGEDTPELRQEILTSTTTALAGIKAQFVNSHTNETVTLSPEDVYKKMTEYIVLLPDNAQS